MATADVERQPHPTKLPPEILLLICQELATDQAFSTLYHLALTTTVVAPIALEQLYGIYDNSPAIFGTYGKRAWGTLWRSILVSTKGLTAYPYAAYLRTLSLGKNLDEDLYVMLRDKALRDSLFAPPLEDLLCLSDGATPPGRVLRTSGLPRIDNVLTVGRCGQAVIEYVEKLANETQAKVALSHLELNTIKAPFDLSDWCRRLGPSLTSLQCRDGTMLHGDLGAALMQSCSNFTDLTLFYCITRDEDNDEEVMPGNDNLTAFFEALKPHTLRGFEVMSRNNITQSTIWSLSRQSQSLRTLKLSCLNRSALRALSRLSECTQLECLTLDNDGEGKVDFIGQDMELANTLSSWIGNCPRLREFHMVNEYDALLMARDLFCTSQAALESMTLLRFALLPPGQNKPLFESLARHKKTLRELKIGDFWEPQDAVERVSVSFMHPETPSILDSICEFKELKSLSLQGATLDQDDLARIVGSLPQLERLQIMTYEPLGDDDLLSFLTFRNLKLLAISSPSDFSHEALLSFVKSLDPVRQNTIEIAIVQYRKNEPWQDTELREHMAVLNGVLNIDVIRNAQGGETDDSSDSDSD